MVKKTIAEFKVEYIQVMDESGKVDASLMPKLTSQQIKQMYEFMVFSRIADAKAIALQRTGRLGTYASSLGQEASQVGSAFALEKTDWLVPTYREMAAMLTHNQPLNKILQYWAGDERGHYVPNVFNLPVSIPIGSQALHAMGIAWALKLQKKKNAALCYFGDGGSSKGDVYEAANMAGVFKVPAVFLCQNNQFAISVPCSKQTASQTIAQKAIAFGFEGVQVDGNDIFAVYKAVYDALQKAKAGNGPTFIECLTYRIGDHTTSDDAKRYRSEAEVAEWKKRDPVERLRKYMTANKLWDEKYEKELNEKFKKRVEEAVEKMEAEPAPKADDFIRYTYADMTQPLKEQQEYLKRFYK